MGPKSRLQRAMGVTRLLILAVTAAIALWIPLNTKVNSPGYYEELIGGFILLLGVAYGWLLSPVLLVTSTVLWASTRRKRDAAATVIAVLWLCGSLYAFWRVSRVYG